MVSSQVFGAGSCTVHWRFSVEAVCSISEGQGDDDDGGEDYDDDGDDGCCWDVKEREREG